MIDVGRVLSGVGQEQVERGHGDAGLDIVEVPITDHDNAQDNRQMGEDRDRPRRRDVHLFAAGPTSATSAAAGHSPPLP